MSADLVTIPRLRFRQIRVLSIGPRGVSSQPSGTSVSTSNYGCCCGGNSKTELTALMPVPGYPGPQACMDSGSHSKMLWAVVLHVSVLFPPDVKKNQPVTANTQFYRQQSHPFIGLFPLRRSLAFFPPLTTTAMKQCSWLTQSGLDPTTPTPLPGVPFFFFVLQCVIRRDEAPAVRLGSQRVKDGTAPPGLSHTRFGCHG